MICSQKILNRFSHTRYTFEISYLQDGGVLTYHEDTKVNEKVNFKFITLPMRMRLFLGPTFSDNLSDENELSDEFPLCCIFYEFPFFFNSTANFFFDEFLLFLNSTKKFSGEFPFCCIFLWILLQRFLLKSPLSVAGDSLSFFMNSLSFSTANFFLMSSHSCSAFCLWICFAILLQIFLIDFHVAGYSWAFWRRSDPCFCSTEEACNVSSKFLKPFDLISTLKLPLYYRPKRIPYFGDSGRLIQRALEASLARHSDLSGQQTPDTLPQSPDTRHSAPDSGPSYTLIRWWYRWWKKSFKTETLPGLQWRQLWTRARSWLGTLGLTKRRRNRFGFIGGPAIPWWLCWQ